MWYHCFAVATWCLFAILQESLYFIQQQCVFRRLRKAIASWSSLVSNWTLIGRTFGFYLRWWVLAFSWCNLWFSIRFWGRTAFKWRRFLLNSPPGVCTVYDLVATTSPDSSWCVTHTYSPGDKTGNSLAPQWVSWFTFCLLFSFLSLVATSEMFGVLGFLWSSIMGTVVHNFLLINKFWGAVSYFQWGRSICQQG